MTGRDMTDAEVRAELERIGLEELWDQVSNIKATLYAKNGSTMSFHHSIEGALRLLAESQRALGEIAEDEIGGSDSHCPDCIRKREIARKHWKGGSNG